MSKGFTESKKRGDNGAAMVQEFLRHNNNCCWRYKTSYRGSAAEYRNYDIPCKQNKKHRYVKLSNHISMTLLPRPKADISIPLFQVNPIHLFSYKSLFKPLQGYSEGFKTGQSKIPCLSYKPIQGALQGCTQTDTR